MQTPPTRRYPFKHALQPKSPADDTTPPEQQLGNAIIYEQEPAFRQYPFMQAEQAKELLTIAPFEHCAGDIIAVHPPEIRQQPGEHELQVKVLPEKLPALQLVADVGINEHGVLTSR